VGDIYFYIYIYIYTAVNTCNDFSRPKEASLDAAALTPHTRKRIDVLSDQGNPRRVVCFSSFFSNEDFSR